MDIFLGILARKEYDTVFCTKNGIVPMFLFVPIEEKTSSSVMLNTHNTAVMFWEIQTIVVCPVTTFRQFQCIQEFHTIKYKKR
jgi:hypothetical protein